MPGPRRRGRKAKSMPGLENEPHLQPPRDDFDDDDLPRLEDEPARASAVPDQPVDFSVADEPGLGWVDVDRAASPGFRELLRERCGKVSPGTQLLVAILVAIAAGPFAVVGVFVEAISFAGGFGVLLMIVLVPVAEEMMKIAALLWLVERKPWLLPGTTTIIVLGIASGVGFAVIENVIYLTIYFPNPSLELIQWRWTVCVAMHAAASTVAACGVARMWRKVMRSGVRADLPTAFPWLAGAMVIHGGYNALVSMIDLGVWE